MVKIPDIDAVDLN